MATLAGTGAFLIGAGAALLTAGLSPVLLIFAVCVVEAGAILLIVTLARVIGVPTAADSWLNVPAGAPRPDLVDTARMVHALR